ncbi:hypothetical protein ASD91_00310 [Pseudomonas sp. Root68]|nr:hypothetical protein ASD91_00310 [Pseudomonas sp. Root68]KRB65521.1 hypothetical protein ASD95_12840 [Pseudomonas sp. Root71]
MLGDGPMLRQTHVNATANVAETATTQENTILSLWRLLDEDDRCAIQSALEEKRRLRDLETQLSEMAAILATLGHSNKT